MQVIANLDHPRFVRRRVVADRCDARRAHIAHMASEKRFIAFPQRQPRPGIATLPGADRGQQALMRFPGVFCFDVAENAEENGERRQALETVDHFQNARLA